jgi:para-aminobenzoate synthetase/4-amino-4-deoxychorismate lyase
MKGTARRGRTLDEDRARRDALRASSKEQAENVMIVDMIRNDLGRIATTGTVRVTDLFALERYPNVWQMTSTVTAESTATLDEVFAAMHPSASVTGAPKVRTMELLRGWEDGPRGVYTGAVGYVAPGGRAHFNVAIRTAVVDHERGRVHFGVGAGIVWDSDPQQEYEECLAKGAVFGSRRPSFELLETLLWSPGEGFLLLERHLGRMRGSAEYFGFANDETATRSALNDAVQGAQESLRVRVLAGRNGSVRVETLAFQPEPAHAPVRLALATGPVDVDDVFLYHKTTHREVYDRARRPAHDETLLWNARGEVTEATIGNVVVELNGRRLTPPVACGLLAGTFRAELLARGEVAEAVIPVSALGDATRVWLINSVQGWKEAILELGNREIW